ncbi:hypothetical protein DFH28DRAFT_1118674 [Melampsora americana]|nr:hypothetical protein DFH28DRAFT_1118674 [Melampsora americana]
MDVSKSMIKAIKPVNNFERIGYNRSSQSSGIYEPNTSTNLIDAIPQLQFLSLFNQWRLHIKSKPNALPNSRQITFALFSDKLEGLAYLCEIAKDNLKLIQIHSIRNIKKS